MDDPIWGCLSILAELVIVIVCASFVISILFSDCSHESSEYHYTPQVSSVPVATSQLDTVSPWVIEEAVLVDENGQPMEEVDSYTETSSAASPLDATETTTERYFGSDYEDEDSYQYTPPETKTDNYILGFDEDVDDVHDMELYMEDYY